MINREDAIERLRIYFEEAKDGVIAIGDETRQSIILALLSVNCYPGMRVGELTKKTHLSRPTVSHHLKILKEADIIGMRKEGTMNFYYLSPKEDKILKLKMLVNEIEALIHDPSRMI